MTYNRALQVIGCAVLLAGCAKPIVVKEPYSVESVREVYLPVPSEYVEPLAAPKLKDGPVMVKDLAELIEEWKAFGRLANEHRSKVKQLTEGAADADAR